MKWKLYRDSGKENGNYYRAKGLGFRVQGLSGGF